MGNYKGENSIHSILKEADVVKINELWMAGISRRVIGELFGVRDSTIANIIYGKTWQHLGLVFDKKTRLPKRIIASGVYGILNIRTFQWYVGSSVDIERRIYEHFWKFKVNNQGKLYRSMGENGVEFFYPITLEIVEDLNKLRDCELRWIKDLNCIESGYNTLLSH